MMQYLTRNLTRGLNVLLIVAMLTGLLPPPAYAMVALPPQTPATNSLSPSHSPTTCRQSVYYVTQASPAQGPYHINLNSIIGEPPPYPDYTLPENYATLWVGAGGGADSETQQINFSVTFSGTVYVEALFQSDGGSVYNQNIFDAWNGSQWVNVYTGLPYASGETSWGWRGRFYTGRLEKIRFVKTGQDAQQARLAAFRVTPQGGTACFEAVPAEQSYSPNECPISACGNTTQHFVGGPINTFSGNYTYQTTDFSIAVVGQPLRFERTYNSLPVTGTVVYTRPLGYGWTHNYDINLTFGTGEVVLKAPHGSRMRFSDNGDGTYTAYPGVWASLTRTLTTPYVYTVTAANQETFVFNDTGRLTRHLDPQGNATELSRTGGLTLTRVTDAASGRYLDFGYDGQGRLSTVTDSANRTVRYGYDAADNLSQVVDTQGLTWTYTYSGAHLLHAITDPTGKVIERTFFDPQGRATRQENGASQPVVQISYVDTQRVITAAGRVITDTYNGLGLWVSQSNAANQTERYSFDTAFNRTGVVDARNNPITYTRTPVGLTTAITDALNGGTRLGYDSRNNLTSVTDARNNTVSYGYDAQNNLTTVTTISGTTVYTYNSRGQVTAIRDANGNLTQYGYDPATGDLTQITNAQSQSSTLQYDNLGRLTQFTNARNVVTRYEYDHGDHLTRMIENYRTDSCPPSECNLTTQYGYDGAGRLVSLTDPKGRVTRSEYDAAGRLERVIENYQNGVHESGEAPDRDVITRYEYDSSSRLFQVIDPLGRQTRLVYNSLNQVRRVIRNFVDGSYTPASPDKDLVTTYSYDAAGNLTHVINNANETTTLTYDALNRLIQLQTPLATLQYRYDGVGNRTALIDPRNLETRYNYDALNRLTAVIEAYQYGVFNPSTPDQDIITRYGYDPVGNLTRLTNPKSQLFNLQYDSLNRLTAFINPLNQAARFGYNAVGNTTVITDANLQVTSLAYDPINRLTGINYPGSTPDVTLGYDPVGNRLTLTDGTGSTTYTYDNLDRLAQAAVGGQPSAVSYSYDLNGNRLSLTYPTGQSVAYGYDGLDRLKTVTDWTSGRYTYTYNSAGRLADLTRPNNVKTSYDYDTAGRLLTLTHQSTLTNVIARYVYTLDAAGNRRQVVETIATCAKLYYLPVIFKSGSGTSSPTAPPDSTFSSPITPPQSSPQSQPAPGSTDFLARFIAYLPLIFGGSPEGAPSATPPGDNLQIAALPSLPAACRPMTITRTLVYTYDNLYRLTEARYSTGENYRYTYDAVGNRLSQTAPSTGSGQGLTRTTVYTYDAANRLTQVNTQTYTYDNNGNLLADGLRAYSYDAANRLITVTQGATTTQFQYNGDGDRTRLTQNGVATNYVFDPTGLTQVLAETTGSQTRQYLPGLAQYEAGAWAYQLPDGLESVRQLVNSSRQLTLLQNYDPFGNPTQMVGSPASPFGYTGEQIDPTGLVFLRARYYNPGIGRFITPDSLIPDPLSSEAWNRYAYAGNNPIRYTDPSGHCFIFAGLDTTLCLTAWAVIGLTAAGGTSIYLSQHQAEIKAALESIPAIPLPPFQLPGTTLEEDINPCYEAGPNVGQPDVWQLPPFSLGTPPYFGPVGPGFSTNPGIELPNILTANPSTERHHLLPRQFRHRFAGAGLDIEDYVQDLPRDFHKDVHGRGGGDAWINSWNKQWERFFDQRRNPSAGEILQQLEKMKKDFGIP